MLSAMALTSGFAQAQSLDTDAALDLARQFFASHNSGASHRAPAQVAPVLSYTATTEGMPDFYVFNRGADAQGFVIINADGADDEAILGYSDSGSFDYDTAPDALRWWLGEYQRNGVAKVQAKAAAGRNDVAPLLTTQWGQNEPYNLAIPRLTERSKRFYTGCTATAMAQVMKYYSYPTTGRGAASYQTYTWTTQGNVDVTPTFEADFEHTTYDWDSMQDAYARNDQSAAAQAVATLMYHAGVAEHADFGQNETSADDRNSAIALINNFRYSPSMLRGDRAYFTDEAWDNTIYQELAAHRPVIYSGTTTEDEGHTFVCDGYQASTGLFHMNWGWEGLSDGYFALTGDVALNPNEQGAGGAISGKGFTESQTINYNILPSEAGEAPVQACVFDHFTVGTDRLVNSTFGSRIINRTTGGDIPVYYRLVSYNNGFSSISIQSGVILRHQATGLTFPQFAFENVMTLGPSQIHEFYHSVSEEDDTPLEFAHFDTSKMPYSGTYDVVPAYTVDNGVTWHPMQTLASDVLPTITIVGGASAEPVELPFTLSASQVEIGKTIAITPHTDYTGEVTYASSDPTIATVSTTGVVTGLKEGHVVVTATSTSTAAFLATTRQFEIDVVAHIMHNADVTLSKKRFTVGETASISVGGGYEGEVTYSVAPAGVVSVSPTGVVTALAEGEALITVNVAGNADYNAATKHFEVTVSNVPPAPAEPGFCMDSYPYAGEDNIVTSTDMTLHIPLNNSSESSIETATFYVRMYCNGGYVTWTCGFGNTAYPSGYHHDYAINPIEKGLKGYFTPGNVYKYEFYIDEECNKPMNVPSLTYYYCPDNASVSTLANFIDDAKKGNGATVKLIKALVNKLLGK